MNLTFVLQNVVVCYKTLLLQNVTVTKRCCYKTLRERVTKVAYRESMETRHNLSRVVALQNSLGRTLLVQRHVDATRESPVTKLARRGATMPPAPVT